MGVFVLVFLMSSVDVLVDLCMECAVLVGVTKTPRPDGTYIRTSSRR